MLPFSLFVLLLEFLRVCFLVLCWVGNYYRIHVQTPLDLSRSANYVSTYRISFRDRPYFSIKYQTERTLTYLSSTYSLAILHNQSLVFLDTDGGYWLLHVCVLSPPNFGETIRPYSLIAPTLVYYFKELIAMWVSTKSGLRAWKTWPVRHLRVLISHCSQHIRGRRLTHRVTFLNLFIMQHARIFRS